jgi:hypothetical protein
MAKANSRISDLFSGVFAPDVQWPNNLWKCAQVQETVSGFAAPNVAILLLGLT